MHSTTNSTAKDTPPCNIANWGSNRRTPAQEIKRWITINDSDGNTLLHDLLASRIFLPGHVLEPNIPPAGVYEKGLHRKNTYGNTPLHNAAETGHLHWIPITFLTKKGLTAPNDINDPPLHNAARRGQLNKIPIEFLTEENLSMPNGNKLTALELAESNNNIDQLLGIKFSPAILALVSHEWYDKNEQLLKQRESVIQQEEQLDIEIF